MIKNKILSGFTNLILILIIYCAFLYCVKSVSDTIISHQLDNNMFQRLLSYFKSKPSEPAKSAKTKTQELIDKYGPQSDLTMQLYNIAISGKKEGTVILKTENGPITLRCYIYDSISYIL